ncbi:MAG: hypothetical protein HC875_21160 [Anaerolineales bacterium]|nr:hypothetical protein [Anaerolineales bacterium]
MNVAPVKFKRDSHLRAKLFHPDSFKHAGKMNLNLIFTLLEQIPGGELIVDPMGGTGSILVATDKLHPVICGELESHWAQVAEMNRVSISRGRLFSASTPSLCPQWDATRLPLRSSSVGAIITSPPYWDMLSDWHINSKGLQDSHEVYGPAYGVAENNLGNIHIYEDHLRAMARVYRESSRVLRPQGNLILVLKDRIHKRSRVPIVRDTVAMVTALGFDLVKRIDRACIPSLHRNINQAHHPTAPTVDTEQALIFQKKEINTGLKVGKISLHQSPKPDSAPSWQLYSKSLAYAEQGGRTPILFDCTGVKMDFAGIEQTPNHSGFRRRKEFAFDCAADIVMKLGFAAGTTIELHCSMTYGQYLAQRLETFGFTVSNPTGGLNLGQKLKWYTEKAKNGCAQP